MSIFIGHCVNKKFKQLQEEKNKHARLTFLTIEFGPVKKTNS